ncbi:UNVERIFIED_ORG: CheY-like chemotaxis protein [Bradyrhizobium japonicum]|uniref:response regulator n=1 Tax=Bradyrhizobium diazoefficiens TaxID=1355477 RepID=UPI0034761E90
MSNFVTLLVEDNPPQREIMSDLLRDEGFEVVECATSACPPTAARKRTLSDFREGPISLKKAAVIRCIGASSEAA